MLNSPGTEVTITKAVAEAADRFVSTLQLLPESVRDQWFAYLLEGLEADLGPDALLLVQRLIGQRFADGSW